MSNKPLSILIRVMAFTALFLSLSGCKWFTGAGTPFYMGMGIKVPNGTPSFQKGFVDGCKMVRSARGNSFMRQFYGGYHYDPKMISNPEYRFGYSRGTTWCFQTTIGPQAVTSPDRYIAPYGNVTTFEMTSSDIGNAWGGLFGGTEGKAMGEMAGGNVNGIMSTFGGGVGGVLSGNPIWAGGSSGQFFGQ